MALVMKNNIFEWEDLYFLQLLGTAMGTYAACMCATIYFAVHEMGTIIPKYNNNLLLLGNGNFNNVNNVVAPPQLIPGRISRVRKASRGGPADAQDPLNGSMPPARDRSGLRMSSVLNSNAPLPDPYA